MLNGLWRSEGYGWILELNDGGYTLHHAGRVNCLAAERGSLEDFQASYDRVEVRGDRLTLNQAGDLTRYAFQRIAALPDVPRLAPGASADPRTTFDTLWDVFDEHYAFFELHGVDWAARRALRERATPALPADALFNLCAELLQPLDDGHVTLAGAGRFHQRARGGPLREAMRATLGTPNGRVTPRTTVDALGRFLPDGLLGGFARTRTELRSAGNGALHWCELAPGVGYLGVLRLFGFADTPAHRAADDLPHARRAVAAFLREDMTALEHALDRAFLDLARCRALVIDLRFNGGGFDRAGLAIAGRLAQRRTLAFTKRARGAAEAQDLHVQPVARPFAGPVVVLTSPLCVSAGEICVLGLRALPQVLVMGLPTAGMLSDNLNKPLPNGWEASLSNEVYTAADGAAYEGRGVPPAVALPALAADDFTGSLQRALATAVAHCRQEAA